MSHYKKFSIQMTVPHAAWICVLCVLDKGSLLSGNNLKTTTYSGFYSTFKSNLPSESCREPGGLQHTASDENTCSPAALTFMLIVWSHLWSNRNYWSKQFTGKHFCVPNTSLHAMCVKHPIVLCNYSYHNDFIISIHNLSTHPFTQNLISTTNPSLQSH